MRRRLHRSRRSRRPLLVKPFMSRYKRQKIRTRRKLRRGANLFTRIYEQKQIIVKPSQTGSEIFHLDMYDQENSSNRYAFKRIMSNYQQFKVHKVVVRVVPHVNMSYPTKEIGPYCVTPYFLENDNSIDQKSTIPDADLSYTLLCGLPESRQRRGYQSTSIAFVPRIARAYRASNETGAAVSVNNELVPANRVWISTASIFPNNLSQTAPRMQGFAFSSQGISADQVTYTFDIFYYITCRGLKTQLRPTAASFGENSNAIYPTE